MPPLIVLRAAPAQFGKGVQVCRLTPPLAKRQPGCLLKSEWSSLVPCSTAILLADLPFDTAAYENSSLLCFLNTPATNLGTPGCLLSSAPEKLMCLPA